MSLRSALVGVQTPDSTLRCTAPPVCPLSPFLISFVCRCSCSRPSASCGAPISPLRALRGAFGLAPVPSAPCGRSRSGGSPWGGGRPCRPPPSCLLPLPPPAALPRSPPRSCGACSAQSPGFAPFRVRCRPFAPASRPLDAFARRVLLLGTSNTANMLNRDFPICRFRQIQYLCNHERCAHFPTFPNSRRFSNGWCRSTVVPRWLISQRIYARPHEEALTTTQSTSPTTFFNLDTYKYY